MSNRTLRINELIQRELSDILHSRHQAEAVALTVTAVEIAPDLRDGRIHISVLGDAEFAEQRLRWLRAHHKELRHELGRRVILKYLPRFTYVLDESAQHSNRVLQILDQIGPPPAKGPAAG